MQIGPALQVPEIGYRGHFKSIDEQVLMTLLHFDAEKFAIDIRREKNGVYSAAVEGLEETDRKTIEPPESCYGIPHKATSLFKGLFPLEFQNKVISTRYPRIRANLLMIKVPRYKF